MVECVMCGGKFADLGDQSPAVFIAIQTFDVRSVLLESTAEGPTQTADVGRNRIGAAPHFCDAACAMNFIAGSYLAALEKILR